jgi:hypothetical protein
MTVRDLQPVDESAATAPASVLLYWIPLGAGGHVVQRSGRIYEAVRARIERRKPCHLYHSALEVRIDSQRFVIEMTPAWGVPSYERGVVSHGPVGSTVLGRSALFRYEVRRWRNGTIPDAPYAVDSPREIGCDAAKAALLLASVSLVPTPTWGRDELMTGDMWNSNSLIAWLLASSGHDVAGIHPPTGGRAPGWRAGFVAAHRTSSASDSGDDAVGDVRISSPRRTRVPTERD